MTHATIYPGANRTAQWRGSGGATMPKVTKLLLHTTESPSWPAYPSFQPTLTFHPWKPRGQRWRQHLPINGSASTLANAGTYRTNRANVCQVEIVGYCDLAYAKRYGNEQWHISHIPADAYDELGEFLAWLHREWEVDLFPAVSWPAYPGGYGATSTRMSTAEFTSFSGVCGHMHAPGNDHGDPGDLNVPLIVAAARKIIDQPTKDDEVKHTTARGLVMNCQGGQASTWAKRRPGLVDVINDTKVSWVAAQEVNESQAADLNGALRRSSGHDWVYRQELDLATYIRKPWSTPDARRKFWRLPQHPDRPAGYPRGLLLTGVVHDDTGEVWWIGNTHLTANGYPAGMTDDQARDEREMQARAIVAHLTGFRWFGLFGDLNSASRDDGFPQGIFDRAGFTSLRDRADVTRRTLPTFDTGKPSQWIDYAGLGPGCGFYKGSAVVDLAADSDHKALLVPVWLRKRDEATA